MKKILFACILMLFPIIAYSGTYWVDDDGTALWAKCASASPLSGANACSLNTANANAVAGDTIYLRGGTYTVNDTLNGIVPAHSGSAGSPITYQVYSTETVNLVGQADIAVGSVGIYINGHSYIVVNGVSLGQLNLTKMKKSLWIGDSDSADSTYNEVKYVYAYDTYESDSWSWIWQTNTIYKRAYYNHVHNCKFERHGWLYTGDSDNEGNLFDIGAEAANTSVKRTYYNVIENNEFLHGGHSTFGLFGDHNVVRNNYFHNEPWFNIDGTLFGYRDVIGDGIPGYVGYNLFEGNRLGHASPNYTYAGKNGNWGGTAFKLCHPYNIIRYNAFFNNSSGTISYGTYPGNYPDLPHHNYVYNNTFYYNGHYLKIPYSDYVYFRNVGFGYDGKGDFSIMYASVWKNNLFYDNGNVNLTQEVYDIGNKSATSQAVDPAKGNMTISNNFNGAITYAAETDPKFVNTDITDPTSWTLPNLNLQSSSTAIDGATNYLTLANGSGSSSTTLIVDDARYFQDGNFGLGVLAWPASVTMQADWIAVGTVGNIVQIDSISYADNEILLKTPITWSDNDPIWLYRRSDGTRVLYGTNTDFGAYEYDSGAGDTTPPVITITDPTSDPTYSTTLGAINVSGTASDDTAVDHVTWVNSGGGSGTATGTTSWSIANISLQSGVNLITVTAYDGAGNHSSDTLTVTMTPPLTNLSNRLRLRKSP